MLRGGKLLCAAGLLLCAAGVAFAAECTAPSMAALAGAGRSDWRESDAQGSRLVSERGTLRSFGLEARVACGSFDYALRWMRSEGTRDYEGVSNTGFAVQTHARIAGDRFSVAALRALDERLSVGASIGYEVLRRSIAGTESAAGYPERFRWWSVKAGVRYALPLGEAAVVSIGGWAGAGPRGRLWVDLPRADPAEIPLGTSRSLEARVQIESKAAERAAGWHWLAGVVYAAEVIGAGEQKAVFAGTSLIGLVSQPRTSRSSLGVYGGIRYRF